jgi:hypothetical protein
MNATIFRDPTPEEILHSDFLTQDKAQWLSSTNFNPVLHRLRKANSAGEAARSKERKENKIHNLFCSCCFSLEAKEGKESSDAEDYNVLVLQNIKPTSVENKLTKLRQHTGFELNYLCSERQHQTCRMITVRELDKLVAAHGDDKKFVSMVAEARKEAEEVQ